VQAHLKVCVAYTHRRAMRSSAAVLPARGNRKRRQAQTGRALREEARSAHAGLAGTSIVSSMAIPLFCAGNGKRSREGRSGAARAHPETTEITQINMPGGKGPGGHAAVGGRTMQCSHTCRSDSQLQGPGAHATPHMAPLLPCPMPSARSAEAV